LREKPWKWMLEGAVWRRKEKRSEEKNLFSYQILHEIVVKR